MVVDVAFDAGPYAGRWREGLDPVLTSFEETNPGVRVTLSAPGTEGLDLWATADPPRTADGVAAPATVRLWYTTGWRLWARLEGLAEWEGRLSGGIIRPWEKRQWTVTDLAALMGKVAAAGWTPVAVPVQAAEAWSVYTGSVGAVLADLSSPMTLDQAVDGMERARVLTVFWNDSFPSVIPLGTRSHYRGFPPLSASGEAFAGEAVWLVLSPDAGPEAKALAKYLTSPGVARELGASLRGEWRSWDASLAAEDLPAVVVPSGL